MVLNTVRLWRRLDGLASVADSREPVGPGHAFLAASGVRLTDDVRRAASAHARRETLDVLDLVPAGLPAERLLDLARLIDSTGLRRARFARGGGAFHALLVDRARLAAAGIKEREDYTPLELVEVTRTLKKYAPATTDVAVVGKLAALAPADPGERRRLRVAARRNQPVQAYAPEARAVLVAASVAVNPAWGLGVAAFGALQPLLVAGRLRRVGDTPRHLRDRAREAAETVRVAGQRAFTRAEPAGSADGGAEAAVAANQVSSAWAARREISARLRPRYQAEIAAGVEKLMTRRRIDCPWCGSAQIAFRTAGRDTALRKPGYFSYDRCLDCGHVFQNPRISDEGLDFYYRDFYDGLGGEWMEEILSFSEAPYLSRLATGLRHTRPRRWLDVGSAHGHFCLAAKGVLPGTTFDALDMGATIEEARRRGWVDRVYRGMLPDLADEIAGRYDMISMFHYFEHVTDPPAELDAVARALPVGGHVLIEVPNPEGLAFRLLNSYWVGLQPSQHLQLMPADNLAAGLTQRGLRPVEISYGRAHTGGDLAAAVFFLLQRIAPLPDLPWLPHEATPARWAAHAATLAALSGPFLAAAAVDAAMLPYYRSGRRASAYRIVARKEA